MWVCSHVSSSYFYMSTAVKKHTITLKFSFVVEILWVNNDISEKAPISQHQQCRKSILTSKLMRANTSLTFTATNGSWLYWWNHFGGIPWRSLKKAMTTFIGLNEKDSPRARTTCGAVAVQWPQPLILLKVWEELRPHTVHCGGACGGNAALQIHSVGLNCDQTDAAHHRPF